MMMLGIKCIILSAFVLLVSSAKQTRIIGGDAVSLVSRYIILCLHFCNSHASYYYYYLYRRTNTDIPMPWHSRKGANDSSAADRLLLVMSF